MNKKCLIDILGITMAILCAIITGIFGRAWNGGYIFYMFSFLVSGSLIYFLIKRKDTRYISIRTCTLK